ncbi:DUF1015 domain-containing protein [Methanogenium sp. MK-MG]|uniref:DUF1015 domain-containing protein n=1 Tax=Methanogenium sp. MK-MG TaxID=2599926 RepID=UPI0013ECE886|nr:DUF1015 family protein [Methanogenium sp. MK-MG]KAF1077937.1 hypothetical protein MKMG_01147 [Methanogenium sp. MK-MG]
MVQIFSFKAFRPPAEEAQQIASVPYDVVSTDESRAVLAENPQSFLQVIRSEATLPADTDPAAPVVYETAAANLQKLIDEGLLLQDAEPGIYLYRVKQGGSIYTGFVANVSVDDYRDNKIKRHEHTRYDKEADRTRHIDTTDMNTGLVVLLYRDSGEIFQYVASLVPEGAPDGVAKSNGAVHEVFRIADAEAIGTMQEMFAGVDAFYIADGHHRAKSSVNVADKRSEEGHLTPESGRFMAVIFAENRVKIHGYSRLVQDLGDYTPETFMAGLSGIFTVKPYGEIEDTVFSIPPLAESAVPRHVMHMYMSGAWYELSCPVDAAADRIASLDVSLLQKTVLEGMLGITDPRGDPRLQYLGGARPLRDLQDRVDSGKFTVAFSMQPVRVDDVLGIADDGGVMPPKSTWFEPKLLSGLVLHSLK